MAEGQGPATISLDIEKNPAADAWRHRAANMRCATCMWFVNKQKDNALLGSTLGRCRKHAPTMNGYPAVFLADWCGDHKLDENKI